ncbi:MerR family transcriptional regulator [Oscillibacter sp.]|uniref:MerR family transcriptional regulator n=1 Tax=Oscillibacter sp. TaxID=1945593 RepID=UPI00289EBC30|nr:MerR family transcriptional regulator [Oscillibacter sp.]
MTIAEVAEKFDLTQDTLRYYEKVGLIPKVKRTSGGTRSYTEYDCGWIDFIKCMRNAGVQVDALVEYVKLFGQGDSTADARKQMLVRERDRIEAQVAAMQCTLDRLNVKIERYEKDILPVEKELVITHNKE